MVIYLYYFFLCSKLFEQYKSGFEEEIIARTDSVRKQLERLEPQLTILNYMEETDNINDYVMVSNTFLTKGTSNFKYLCKKVDFIIINVGKK